MNTSQSRLIYAIVMVFAFIILSPPVVAQETIVFAVDGDWPPMKMKNAEGNLAGYEIDMIRAMEAEGSFQVKIVEVPWEDIFRELEAGRYDAIMASVSATEERKAKFDFSTPYFSAEQLLVVPKSSVRKPLQGKTIGAFEATTGAAALSKSAVVAVRLYSSAETALAFRDLAEGSIHGILCDSPVAVNYAFFRDAYKGVFAIDSEMSVLGAPSSSEEYAVVVKKGNAAVLTLINKAIGAVKAKGIDYQIRERWISW